MMDDLKRTRGNQALLGEARDVERRAPNAARFVAGSALVLQLTLAGCVQQADLVRQEKDLTAKIAKARADLDQLIGETRARFNQELSALREEELPALRGNMDKGVNRFEAVQRRLDDLENKTAARLGVLEKIQHDQANLLKAERDRAQADRDRLQEELAKLAETVGALAKAVEARLEAYDKTINTQAAQLTQLSRSLAELSAKMEADSKLTAKHLADVNKSVSSVTTALRTVGESFETREAAMTKAVDERLAAHDKTINTQAARLAQLSRSLAELAAKVEADSKLTAKHLADVNKSVSSVATALRTVGEAIETREAEQDRRLDEMAKAVQEMAALAGKPKEGKASKNGKPAPRPSGTAEAGPPAGARTPAGGAAVETRLADGEEKSYEQSLQAFKSGDLEGARKGFAEFLQKYPDSKLAGHAQYWLGECYYGAKEYGQAIEAFDRVPHAYPDSPKVPAALLKKGFAYEALNDHGRAASALKQVVEVYPKSPEAAKAKEKLAQLQ